MVKFVILPSALYITALVNIQKYLRRPSSTSFQQLKLYIYTSLEEHNGGLGRPGGSSLESQTCSYSLIIVITIHILYYLSMDVGIIAQFSNHVNTVNFFISLSILTALFLLRTIPMGRDLYVFPTPKILIRFHLLFEFSPSRIHWLKLYASQLLLWIMVFQIYSTILQCTQFKQP